jgi:hypothetical protein
MKRYGEGAEIPTGSEALEYFLDNERATKVFVLHNSCIHTFSSYCLRNVDLFASCVECCSFRVRTQRPISTEDPFMDLGEADGPNKVARVSTLDAA